MNMRPYKTLLYDLRVVPNSSMTKSLKGFLDCESGIIWRGRINWFSKEICFGFNDDGSMILKTPEGGA